METNKKESLEKNTSQQAPHSHSNWRRILALFLIIIGSISFTLGGIAFWIDHSFVQTDGFVQLADDIIAREEVRVALAEATVDAILEQAPPRAQLARGVLNSVVTSVMEDERFQELFLTAVETGHRGLLEGEIPEFVFGIPDTMENIKNGIALFDPELADKFPDGSQLAEMIELTNETAESIRRWAGFIQQSWPILFLFGIASIGGGVALKKRRWKGVALSGWVLVCTIIVFSILLYFARINITARPDDPVVRDAVRAIWDVLARGVRINMMILAILGLFLGLLGKWADRGGATKLRTRIDEQLADWQSSEHRGDMIWSRISNLSGRVLIIALTLIGIIALAWPEPSVGFLAILFGIVLLALAGYIYISTHRTKMSAATGEQESTEEMSLTSTLLGKKGLSSKNGFDQEPSYTSELRALAKLHKEGIITDKEFETKKRKLLQI